MWKMRGQIYPGFQVVTSMLRGFMVRRVGEAISWHICKKKLPAELEMSFLFCCVLDHSCGVEDQNFVILMYLVYCVILFAFLSWSSSKFAQ